MAYDAARQKVVLFGGTTSESGGVDLNDTCEWDGERWMQVATDGPSERAGHAMVYDAANKKGILFGGGRSDPYENQNGYLLNDTWEYGLVVVRTRQGNRNPYGNCDTNPYSRTRNSASLAGF